MTTADVFVTWDMEPRMCTRAWCRRLTIFVAVLVSLTGLRPSAQTTGVARRPNILLIVTDDQGYGDLGIHGNPTLRTPHLEDGRLPCP